MFTCVLWREVASTVILVPEPFREGDDRVAGQLRASGVTKSGRVEEGAEKRRSESHRKDVVNQCLEFCSECDAFQATTTSLPFLKGMVQLFLFFCFLLLF